MTEWPQMARDFGGWGVCVVMALAIVRALLRGDIVLGREYVGVKEDRDQLRSDLKVRDETLVKNAQANEKLTTSVEALTAVVSDVREQLTPVERGRS